MVFAFLGSSSQLLAQALSEGPLWKVHGSEFLTYQGQTLTFNASELKKHRNRLRCVKMNNYGCMMGRSWNGAVGSDKAGHTVFKHPKWSVRAVVRDYCSKNRRGLKSALQIAEAYSPWCDTLGTVAVRHGWGRTCGNGPKPPANFSGPLCKKPAGGIPLSGQCKSCNCPDGVARAMSASVGVDMSDDLGLFEGDGTPNAKNLTAVLRSKFRRETGFTVSDALLKEGIQLAGECK